MLFDEARAFISNLDSKELEHWWAWKEEWPDWKAVSEIEGLTEMIFRALHVSPPPPPRGTKSELESIPEFQPNNDFKRETLTHGIAPEAKDSELEPSINQITLTKSFSQTMSEFQMRAKRRYNKRMQVTILVGDQQFKTFSKDISVGGILLEDPLPEWVQGYFKARITKLNAKHAVELNVCLVENQPVDERFRIAILPLQSDADEKNLEGWIAA